ncbi:MAG TPA: S8 family peptidase [Gaiellaceae bacterium]|nr:S8 family peptidase [Gaiellaceae bacterium]
MPRRRLVRLLRGPAVTAVAALLLAPGAAPAGGAPGDEQGELIVGFRSGVTAAQQEQALRGVGAGPGRRFVRIRARLVTVPRAGAALRALERSPHVRYVEPNRRVSIEDHGGEPNDPRFHELWGLRNFGQTAGWLPGTPDADVDAPEAWRVSTGAGVVVGVVDTGVDLAHPELAPNLWTNPGEVPGNHRDDDGNGYVDDVHGWDFADDDADPSDEHGHGTHVAGTIAAVADNGVGVAGVAPEARVMALRMLGADGSGTVADAVEALLYAVDNGAAVTNNSWGDTEDSQAVRDAVAAADVAGVLVVAAAGNSASDNDETPHYPSGIDAPNVVSVAATDNRDALAWFSNVGVRTVDLGAPGASILSTWPGGGYQTLDGTSMATPHVSGAAALAKAAFPGASAVGLKALLLRSVDPLTSLAGDTAAGGRLNADHAVRCASAPQLWLDEPGASFDLAVGQTVPLRVLAARCGDPSGVTVSATANGVDVPLTARGDGLYTGTVVAAGTGALVVTVTASAGGATDSRTVTGLVDATFDAVLGGPPVTVTTTAAGQNAKVRFAGAAGRVLAIRASSVTMSSAKLTLVAPDGTTLVRDAYVFASGTFLEPGPLPASGDYVLTVDPQGTATGSMTLTLYDVPPDVTATAQVGGPAVTVAPSVPGQNARVRFTGTAGRSLSVKLTAGTLVAAYVSLLAPDGSRLVAPVYVGARGGFVEPLALPATGTYTVLVDPTSTYTGSLGVTLYDVPPDATATAVPGGAAATVAATVPGQNARVFFDGTAGTNVSAKLTGVTMTSARVSLLAPDGSTLVAPTYLGTSGGFVEPKLLPATGRYTVLVDPLAETTGSATLTLYLVPPDAAASATVGGPPVRVTTTAPGQNASVTVSGTAGTLFALRVTDVTLTSATVRLLAPDGTTVVPTTYVLAGGTFVEPRPLPATGDYRLLVDPLSANVGSLTLAFLAVPPDATAAALVGGPSVGLAVTVPGQNARVTFAAGAGQAVTVALTGVTVPTTMASVRAPDGTTVVQPLYVFTSGKTFAFTAAQAGTYTVVLDPLTSYTGAYTVALR